MAVISDGPNQGDKVLGPEHAAEQLVGHSVDPAQVVDDFLVIPALLEHRLQMAGQCVNQIGFNRTAVSHPFQRQEGLGLRVLYEREGPGR
jgi:hypothetical protein